ncbi:MAG: hypothetical protein SFY96_08150 [Planctomycetota bacterium]|nr:hypothetical protein [Planctomycetota bacterium]
MNSLSVEIAKAVEVKTAEPRVAGVLYLVGKDQIGALRLASDFLCLRRAKVTRTLLRPFATYSVRVLAFEATSSEYAKIIADLAILQDQFPRSRVAIFDAIDAPSDDRLADVMWLWVRGGGDAAITRVKAALKQAVGPSLVGSPVAGVVYHRSDAEDETTEHTLGVIRAGGFQAAAARELRQLFAQISPASQVLCASDELSFLRAA